MPRLCFVVGWIVLVLGCSPEGGLPDPDPEPEEEGLHGRIQTVDGIEVLELWGTRYEMGYAEGALYCDKMPTLFKEYVLDYLVADYDIPYEVIQLLVENSIELEPGDRDELEGLWDGALDHCEGEDLWVESDYLEDSAGGARDIVFEDLIAANILGDYACSSFTAWGEASASGDSIHARNFDWAIDPGGTFLDQHIVKAYSSEEEGGARYASVTTPGLIGCVSCVTEEAVALTMHNVGGLDATQNTGWKPRMLAAREALAATWQSDDPVGTAEAILEARPQRRGNNLHLSFPVALGGGHGGVVYEYDGASDHSDGQATVRSFGESANLDTSEGVACTNHYIKRTEPPTSGNSYDRIQTLQNGMDQAIPEGGLDANAAHDLIAEVANQYTAHTVIVDTAAREFWVYVAPEPGLPATDADPHVLDLDELFADLP